MLGTTLAQTVLILKSELASSLSVGDADDTRYYQLVETKQEWFASMYDWRMLRDTWQQTVNANTAFAAFPTTDVNGNTRSINFDRPLKVFVSYSNRWQPVDFDIGEDEENVFNASLGQYHEPVLRWTFKEGDRSQFEIWPVAQSAQTIRFTGQRKLTTLRTATALDPTLTLELDDRLIAFSIAVDILTAREDPSAKVKAEMLAALWKTLRPAEGSRNSSYGLYKAQDTPPRRVVPITVG